MVLVNMINSLQNLCGLQEGDEEMRQEEERISCDFLICNLRWKEENLTCLTRFLQESKKVTHESDL